MLRIGDTVIERVEEYLGPAFLARELLPDFDHGFVAEHRSWLVPTHYDQTTDQLIMSSHAWVLRTHGKVLLIDTCIGNGKSRPHSPMFHLASFPFLDNLAAAGLAPEQVDFVLCTHLHADHVGWNTLQRNGRWVPTFPNAKYVFSRRDCEFFHWKNGPGAGDEDARNVFEDSVLPTIESKQDLQVDGVHDLGYGVTIEPSPGHSPGHVVIRVRTGREELLFSGDVLHHPIQVHRPEWSSAFCADPEQSRQTRRRLLEQVAERGSLLLPAHFAGDHACRIGAVAGRFVCLPPR